MPVDRRRTDGKEKMKVTQRDIFLALSQGKFQPLDKGLAEAFQGASDDAVYCEFGDELCIMDFSEDNYITCEVFDQNDGQYDVHLGSPDAVLEKPNPSNFAHPADYQRALREWNAQGSKGGKNA